MNDEIDEPHAAGRLSAPDRRVKYDVLGLMAAMFSRRSEAR